MEQDKRHIPKGAGEPHNEHTRPAENPDKDKLRENPHNDEKTISRNDPERKSDADLKTGSTFAEKDEEGQNRVINEEEQKQVVNPGPRDWESSATQEEPETPSKNPYEEIGDDPEESRKKIPKM